MCVGAHKSTSVRVDISRSDLALRSTNESLQIEMHMHASRAWEHVKSPPVDSYSTSLVNPSSHHRLILAFGSSTLRYTADKTRPRSIVPHHRSSNPFESQLLSSLRSGICHHTPVGFTASQITGRQSPRVGHMSAINVPVRNSTDFTGHWSSINHVRVHGIQKHSGRHP